MLPDPDLHRDRRNDPKEGPPGEAGDGQRFAGSLASLVGLFTPMTGSS